MKAYSGVQGAKVAQSFAIYVDQRTNSALGVNPSRLFRRQTLFLSLRVDYPSAAENKINLSILR